MRELLDKVWSFVEKENVKSFEEDYKEKHKEIFRMFDMLKELLYDGLSEEQKRIFDKFLTLNEDVKALERREMFVIGARYAMKFMFETKGIKYTIRFEKPNP
ncbi:MAG: hypothetical protein IKA74_03545 [Clostridia bacterium]|nr:hypothetical protein [Clostridia bacterium]